MASSVIAPSILSADFSRLGEEARRVEEAGADWLHVDIMDGHFGPNLTFGPDITAALKRSTRLPLDVHLMIERPDQFWKAFHQAGADRITVHVEASHPVRQTLRSIRESGCRAGIAFNPSTPCAMVEPYLEEVDLVLCMTVFPGFSGQAFMPEVVEKIAYLAQHAVRQKNSYRIEVDGGINTATAAACAKAGADSFVAGTSLFRAENMAAAISEMRNAIRAV